MSPGPESAQPTEPVDPASAESTSEVAAPPTSAPDEEDWAARFKYLLADFENFRKRAQRDSELARTRGRVAVLRELIPIYEAVQGAVAALGVPGTSDAVREGVDLIATEFRALLEREGVQPVAAVGAPFDPSVHEAVGEAAVSNEAPEGTVGGIVQQGYQGPGGLLRPAKVLIARPTAPPEAESSEGSDGAAPNGSGEQ